MEIIGQNKTQRVCFVQFARWRHRCRIECILLMIFVKNMSYVMHVREKAYQVPLDRKERREFRDHVDHQV